MSLFLRAASGEYTERAPIWVMRQAGRYLPEYMAIREKYSFWEVCKNPELAIEVTLQPIRRFGMDAAILFSDIMTPLSPMGVDIDFAPGPIIAEPIRSMAAVEKLRVPVGDEIAPFVADTIQGLRKELSVPVIGFGGAPLTLATYLVQGSGSKDYAMLRKFLREEPAAAHALLTKITDVSINYLKMQVEAGAQAIQLFDSWAGLHDREMYAEFGFPYADRVLKALESYGVPRIYLAVGANHLFPIIKNINAETISVDWRIPLNEVREQIPGKALQGNLDPAVLLGPADDIRKAATRVLEAGLGGAHCFNLGHGIFRYTNPDNVAVLVDTVKAFERKRPE